MMPTNLRVLALLGAFMAAPLMAQTPDTRAPMEIDVAGGYQTVHLNATNGVATWQPGGFVEGSVNAYKGIGAAVNVYGGSVTNFNSSGVNLNMIVATIGPRYTWTPRRSRMALFGQALIGEAHGFDGVYPSIAGPLQAFDSVALVLGGGVDVHLSRRFAVRPVEASWMRTRFPNATNNVQHNFQIGAGFVYRFQRK